MLHVRAAHLHACRRACARRFRFRSLRGGIAVVAAIAPSRAPRQRRSYARLRRVIDVPNLIDIQVASFRAVHGGGPARDHRRHLADRGLHGHAGRRVRRATRSTRRPSHIEECREKDLHVLGTALDDRPLHQQVDTGEIREQRVFMGDFPLMTECGHVHHQRHRARRRDAARAFPGRLHPGAQGRREAALHRQPDAVPRLVARARDRQEGPRHGPHRPQAQAADHDAPARAARTRTRRRASSWTPRRTRRSSTSSAIRRPRKRTSTSSTRSRRTSRRAPTRR